ncbi:unnamed protein product, partial [marine sediment metagenome]
QKYLMRWGVSEKDDIEIKFSDDAYQIKGRADGKFKWKGEMVGLEIKSMNMFGFNALKEPKPDHVKQFMLYLKFLELDKGLMVYECKNTQNIKAWWIKYNEHAIKFLLRIVAEAVLALKNRELPAKICEGRLDKDCEFRVICEGGLQFQSFEGEK